MTTGQFLVMMSLIKILIIAAIGPYQYLGGAYWQQNSPNQLHGTQQTAGHSNRHHFVTIILDTLHEP